MSADNYHLVDKRPDGYYVVLANLNASLDTGPREWNRMTPSWRTNSMDSALRAAHKLAQEQYTEYGVILSARAKVDL